MASVEVRQYPEAGQILIHRTFGFKGKFVQEVYVNGGRRHFLVSDLASAKRYVLPDNEWTVTNEIR